MYKLSATDAGFLYAETPLSPMHVASVQVLSLPESVTEDEFIASLKPFIATRSHLVPYLTNRLQATPFDLDHPLWVRDPEFDIGRHIYRVDVPAPGGQAELEQTVAELHAKPMDRSRPLWEIAVLCGLANGDGPENRRVAYYNRVHHACLDGMAGQAATMTLMDTEPKPRAIPTPSAEFTERTAHYDSLSLMLDAWRNFATMQIDQFTGWPERLNTGIRLWQRALDPSKDQGVPYAPAPKTAFNRPVGTPRTYAVDELAVADIKAVGRELDATLNDVLLAVCGGGLRRYLEAKGELPRAPLIAGCPVSLRQPGDASLNNQVTMMQVALGTDIAEAKALPDAGRLRDAILDEFIELKAAVLPAPPTNVHPLSVTAPLSAEMLPRVA